MYNQFMDESIQTETPHYNLESLEIDWTQVKPKEEEKGKWSFEVSDRQTGRKVGYEFAKALGVLFVCQDDLEDPKPAEDVRMDGNQISFSEYDAELEHAGDVKVVEIDRKSTRLNSSHMSISYAVFCLKNELYQNIKHSLLRPYTMPSKQFHPHGRS